MISDQQLNIMKSILASGAGMASACQALRIHPKTMTQYLKVHSDKLEELNNSLLAGYTAISSQIVKAIKEGKSSKSLSEQQASFIKRITLWGDSCKGEEPSLLECLSALEDLSHNKAEAAIAVGLEKADFIRKIANGDSGEVFKSMMSF